LQLRRTPEVIFLEDHSLERGDKMLILLNQLSADRKPDLIDGEEEFADDEIDETDED
jgi:ribosome-binding factor A